MAREDTIDYSFLNEINGKLRDLEEKQNLTRDRVLLIGKNLIDSREKTKDEITELKVEIDQLKSQFSKISDLLQNIADDLEEIPRKGQIEAIEKQLDLFSPLEFARREEVEKIMNKHKERD